MHLPEWLAILATFALFAIAMASIAKIMEIDKTASEKMLQAITGLTASAGIIGALLAYFQFKETPEYAIQIVLAIVMLLFLPATLIAAGTMTITLSNAPSPL